MGIAQYKEQAYHWGHRNPDILTSSQSKAMFFLKVLCFVSEQASFAVSKRWILTCYRETIFSFISNDATESLKLSFVGNFMFLVSSLNVWRAHHLADLVTRRRGNQATARLSSFRCSLDGTVWPDLFSSLKYAASPHQIGLVHRKLYGGIIVSILSLVF